MGIEYFPTPPFPIPSLKKQGKKFIVRASLKPRRKKCRNTFAIFAAIFTILPRVIPQAV